MEQDSTQAVKAETTAQEPVVKRLRRGEVKEDGMVFWRYHPDFIGGECWKTPEQFAFEKTKEAEKRADLAAKKSASPTKLRLGDVREDGRVFWCYGPSYENGEYWMPPEKFADEKNKEAKRKAEFSVKRAASTTKLRRGDTREDGMVFWAHNPKYPEGERWLTSEKFTAKKAGEEQKRAALFAKKEAATVRFRPGDVREDGMVFLKYHANYINGERWVTPEELKSERAKTSARARERRATDPLYAIKGRVRCRVSRFLKSKGIKKNMKTEAMLGCTYEEFKAHIESKFLPGMSWANFSDCHIDHLVPLDVANTEEDVYSLSHHTNLRPMWGPDNLAKNAKLPEEHELPINLHPKVKEIWLTAQAR